MAEDTQGNTTPVEVTQEPAMPTGEQKVPEVQEVAHENVQEAVENSQPQKTEGLPSEVSERTAKEFERLKEQLRNERNKRMESERKFSSINTPPPVEPVIDPYTGQVDERLTAIQQRAIQAEQRALQAEQSIANFKGEQEKLEAIKEFPELDDLSPAFDKSLHAKTRALITDSMLNPDDYEGRQLTYKEAAALAKGSKVTPKQIEQVRKEAATEAIEQLSPKEQASLEAVGNPSRVANVSNQSQQDLIQRTRRGDEDAIVARLKNIPSVGKG